MINGKKGKYFTLLLVPASGILLSLSLFYWTYKAEQARMQSRFNEAAGHHFKALEDVVQYNTAALESFGDLYTSSETVSGQEFDTFAQGIFRRQDYIFEFRWLERVADERRNEFEEAMRKSGQADFTIREPDEKGGLIPAHKRKEYFVVRFVSYSPNRVFDPSVIIGLDAASIPERRQAMQFACDNMAMAATGEVRHFGEPQIKASSRIFLPVYRNNLPHQTLQERRENLLGFVVMLYRLDSMIKESIGATPFLGMDCAIYRVDGGRKQLLYFHSARARENPIEASQADTRSGISWSGSLKMADQDWQIACTPAPSFLAANKIVLPWVSLITGLVITLLLTLYLRIVISRARQVELLVKQRTEELEDSKRQIEFILGGTKTNIDIIDAEFNMVYADAQWQKVYGDPKGRKCYEYFMGRDTACFECGVRKAIETKQAVITEETLSREGNRPIQVTTFPYQDKSGRWFVAEVNVDITERKKAEEELRASEERYRVLFDSSQDAIMTLEPPEWNFTAGNPAAIKLFGAKDEREFVSTSPWKLSPEFQPDGKPSSEKAREMIDIAMRQGSNFFEWAHKRFSGEVFPATVLLTRVELGDKKFLQATVRDITGQKKAEQALKLAAQEWTNTFNSISDFIFILDKDSHILKVNKSLLNALHVTEENVVGRKCYEVMHKQDIPWPGCPHQETLADKKAHTEEVEDPGLGIPLLVSTSPILDEKGEFAGSVHIAKDISAIKKVEDELKKSKAELEVEAWGLAKANDGIRLLYKELEEKNEALKKIDQLKSEFVSTVSHELRTPLAIMKEGVSLVLDKITGEVNTRQEKTLNMVASNINRLGKLITDLLDISKIESGRAQLKKKLTDAAFLVKDTAEKWRLQVEEKKQRLSVSVPDKPVRIYLDSDKIIQVLNNLISNAVKYAGSNAQIKVSLAERHDEIELTVSDNGTGIAKEDLAHVFERFQQFSRAPGAGAKGTGLGLAITKELVNMHEGSIAVASELNRGTAFTIILPKMDSEAVFKQHIENGIQEVKAQNSHLSLITVRITQFVSLQQELGFEKAHKFITDIENVIIQAMRRKADTVVRDTGELIILLFDVNRKSAALVKERVSEVIQAYLKERRDAVSINVSFNIGLATFPEEAKSPEELLDKARGVVKVKAENA